MLFVWALCLFFFGAHGARAHRATKNQDPKNWTFSAIPIYWECNGVLCYSDLLGVGVPMNGKVGAMCRLAAAHCTSIFFPMDWASMIGRNVSLVSFSFLVFLLGGTGCPFKL